MARLTEKDSIDNKRYMINSEENTVCVTNARLNNCSTIAYCWGKPIDKLAQLEDIMEEYGIESVEELDKKLNDSNKNLDISKSEMTKAYNKGIIDMIDIIGGTLNLAINNLNEQLDTIKNKLKK